MRSSIVRRSSGADDDIVVELRGLANVLTVLLPRTIIMRELSALVEYLRLDHIWSGLSCEPSKGACDQGQARPYPGAQIPLPGVPVSADKRKTPMLFRR
jgi:hypothetical protein